jgi:ATP-binding cassette subfamily B protein/subfamily B ATP-binding cassette protein MsbA
MTALVMWAVGAAVREWPGLLVVVVAMLLKIGVELLRPWPMKVLVDNVLGHAALPPALVRASELLGGPPGTELLLVGTVAATVVLFLLGWGVGVVASYADLGFGQRIVYNLAGDLFDHLQRLSLRFHSRKPVGDSIRRVTNDCGCVGVIVKDALVPVIGALITLVSIFAVIWKVDAMLAVLALAVVPLMALAFWLYAKPMLERGYAQAEAEGAIYTVVEETLSAMPMVKACSGETRADERFRGGARAALSAVLATSDVQLRFKILVGLATAAGTAGILWVGAERVLDGRLTLGSLLVVLAYLTSLYTPLEALTYAPATIQGAAGSARRVLEVLETDREVVDQPGARTLGRAHGHVHVDDVTFGYDAGRPVLRGVSLEARPGEVVAIVGPTGAGKSTLVSLIPRFFDPWTGAVRIDGSDVRGAQVHSLRQQIALLLQEPFLFPMTVAENIAYGRPGATRAEIEAAARAARADEFIARLPAGYDTSIGERGAALSGGERQRLAIARALVKDAPILILDEPTSSLDAETERTLMGALERLMRGRTVLIIAHRLSTVRRADRIVVVAEGAVRESGTHAQLLAQAGLYARFHDLLSPSAVAEARNSGGHRRQAWA